MDVWVWGEGTRALSQLKTKTETSSMFKRVWERGEDACHDQEKDEGREDGEGQQLLSLNEKVYQQEAE